MLNTGKQGASFTKRKGASDSSNQPSSAESPVQDVKGVKAPAVAPSSAPAVEETKGSSKPVAPSPASCASASSPVHTSTPSMPTEGGFTGGSAASIPTLPLPTGARVSNNRAKANGGKGKRKGAALKTPKPNASQGVEAGASAAEGSALVTSAAPVGMQQLVDAMLSDDAAEVERNLEGGVDLMLPNTDNATVLHVAVISKKVDMLRLLCPRVKGIKVVRAVQEAAGLVPPCMVEEGSGASKEDRDEWPLIDQRDADGQTALFRAATDGLVRCLSVLFEVGGADPEVPDFEGYRPVHAAAVAGHKECVVYLVTKAGASPLINVRGACAGSPLHATACHGKVEGIEALLGVGVPVDLCLPDSGVTPLHVAANRQRDDAMRVLLQHGAEVNRKSHDGRTPLCCAARTGCLATVRLLVESGADVLQADGDGLSPLHQAALAGGCGDVICYLLDHGVDINLKAVNNLTPLYAAACDGRVDSARVLWAKGADLLLPRADGMTPLHAAALEGKAGMVRFLIDEGGLEANLKGEYGRAPLHDACSEGHVHVGQELLERGASVEARDRYGATPLMSAAQKGQLLAVKWLVEQAGADPRATDLKGCSVLQYVPNKGPEAKHAGDIHKFIKDKIDELVLKAAQAASLAAEALLLEEEEDAKRVEAARKKKKAAKKSRSKKKAEPPSKDQAEGEVHDAMAGLSLAEPPHVEEAEEEEEDEEEDETLLRRYVLGQQTSQHATASAKGGRSRTASAQDRRELARLQQEEDDRREIAELARLEDAATAAQEEQQLQAQLQARLQAQLQAQQRALLEAQAQRQPRPQPPPTKQSLPPPPAPPQPQLTIETSAASVVPAAPSPSALLDPDDVAILGSLSQLLCPISFQLMTDPVIAADDITYQRDAIETWIHKCIAARKPVTSPMTGLRMEAMIKCPNMLARSLVLEHMRRSQQRRMNMQQQQQQQQQPQLHSMGY